MEHDFTPKITAVLEKNFGKKIATQLFAASLLLQYLNEKTRSASRGSKSRSSVGPLYSLYALVDDYVQGGFERSGKYRQYEGAQFTQLRDRARQLAFGSKIQNHDLNNRVNHQFRAMFPTNSARLIEHDPVAKRYWINENLLQIPLGKTSYNIAQSVIAVIDAYVHVKQRAFQEFIQICKRMKKIQKSGPDKVHKFVSDLVQPNVDARLFEIVSFAILKQFYVGQSIFWGWTIDELEEARLMLYKTGRTNANDGGIDFVMRPLGRFFQVTETTDMKKYFLDIDKVQRFPITFVIKSTSTIESLRRSIEEKARRVYSVDRVINAYMACIEEVINIPELLDRFERVAREGRIEDVMNEIILQSRVEFNVE
jgi:hypothetical protein